MNTIIFYGKIILGYLWQNKNSLYKLYKEIKKDGKLTFSDIVSTVKMFEKNGVILEEDDDVFVGAIQDLEKNTSKNLIQYKQSSYSCAIYSTTRVVMYNTSVFYTIDEIESIVSLAKELGYLKLTGDNKGMTISKAWKVVDKWTLENKGIKLKYDKVKYGSKEDLERKTLGYSHGLGGYITGKYIADFRGDGIIDEKYNWDEDMLYGHIFTREPDNKITENYPKRFGRHNRYINNIINDFIKNDYFFSWSYYIFEDKDIKEDIVDEMKNERLDNVFLKNSKYAKHILNKISGKNELIFNDYKEEGSVNVSDVKELITLAFLRDK